MRALAIALLLSSFSAAAAPPCSGTGVPSGTIESGQPLVFELNTASLRYVVTGSVRGSSAPPQVYLLAPGDAPELLFMVPRVAVDAPLDLAILGTTTTGDEVLACSSRFSVPLRAYRPLQETADRLVVPIVGTIAGANGSHWKTSLQLTGYGTGALYLRPLGTFHGDDRDPHVRYDLGPIALAGIPGILQIDDLMEEMGATGLANLDVVPDFIDEGAPPYREGFLSPRVEARIESDSGGGRFGSTIAAVAPNVASRGALHIVVPPGYPDRVRVNVGLRTFGEAAHIRVGKYRRELEGIEITKELDLPANSYQQVPLADLLAEAEVKPGDLLLLLTNTGAPPFVGYYSVTDNVSNDTEIFSEPTSWSFPRLRDLVLPYADWF